jgi:hypothetical protein
LAIDPLIAAAGGSPCGRFYCIRRSPPTAALVGIPAIRRGAIAVATAGIQQRLLRGAPIFPALRRASASSVRQRRLIAPREHEMAAAAIMGFAGGMVGGLTRGARRGPLSSPALRRSSCGESQVQAGGDQSLPRHIVPSRARRRCGRPARLRRRPRSATGLLIGALSPLGVGQSAWSRRNADPPARARAGLRGRSRWRNTPAPASSSRRSARGPDALEESV